MLRRIVTGIAAAGLCCPCLPSLRLPWRPAHHPPSPFPPAARRLFFPLKWSQRAEALAGAGLLRGLPHEAGAASASPAATGCATAVPGRSIRPTSTPRTGDPAFGRWSLEAFNPARCMTASSRDGIASLFPAFPYDHFHQGFPTRM